MINATRLVKAGSELCVSAAVELQSVFSGLLVLHFSLYYHVWSCCTCFWI